MARRTDSGTLKRRFINEMFGDYATYLRARKDDYCKVQFEWSCWIDGLCKAGEISQKEYERAVF